jgi:hypothetical protein
MGRDFEITIAGLWRALASSWKKSNVVDKADDVVVACTASR